jgi:SAM-dependent methyltransferase
LKRRERDRRLFDSIASAYGRKDVIPVSRIPREAMLMEALRPLLADGKNLGRILDIGCGVGAPAKFLHGSYSGYRGVDHSEKLIAAARDFNKENSRAQFLAADIGDVPDDWGGADLVLSLGALHHIADLDTVMGRLTELARPGGFLVVVEPQRGNPLIQVMRWVRCRLDPAYSRDQVFFSVRELLDLFGRHGVGDPSVQYVGFFSTPFAEVILRPAWLFLPLSRLATSVDRWLGRHLPSWLGWLSFKVVVRGRFAP